MPPWQKALDQLHPARDVFREEAVHEDLRGRLGLLRDLIRQRLKDSQQLKGLLAPAFRATRLLPGSETPTKKAGRFEIYHAVATASDSVLSADPFLKELESWLEEFRSIEIVDLDVIEVDLEGEQGQTAHFTVDFDVVGPGRSTWRVQKLGQWRLTWQKSSNDQWRILRWQSREQTRTLVKAPLFVDATLAALGHNASIHRQLRHGADHWRRIMDGVLGPDVSSHSGVAAGDVDGDGRDDLYVCQPSGLPNRLFRNNGGGTFTDITEEAGVGLMDATPMALFADVENDGDQDLVVVTWTQPLLYVNDGKGRFSLQKDAFHLAEALQGTLIAAAMADFDRDGFLDLYLCTYNYFVGKSEASLPTPYHDAQNGPPNILLRNDGRGRFVDVTAGSGMDGNNNRLSLAPAWADYDGDGWPDLYVANDFGRNNLYRSRGLANGRVTFADVAAKAGVEDIGAGMSSAWLDFDHDGFLDLYVANMWSSAGRRLTRLPNFQSQALPEVAEQLRRHAKGNSLFRNRGDGSFEDVSLKSRTFKGRWAWASDSLDFDNDGWDDIYVTNGMITNPDPDPSLGDLDSFYWRRVVGLTPLVRQSAPAFEDAWRALIKLLQGRGSQAAPERNAFFHNNGDGTFDNVAGAFGLDLDRDSRALAIADYDQDGDLDFFVKNRNGPQLHFFRNDGEEGHASVAIRLVGTLSNRDAIGAVVRVETDHGRFTKVLQCASGYLSQRGKDLLFGLGRSREIRRVTITWPSGAAQTLARVPVNHRVTVTEGSDSLAAEPFRRRASQPASAPADVARLQDVPYAGTWIHERYPAPDFTLSGASGTRYVLSEQKGRPLLLHFWSAACAPCRDAIRSLDSGRAEIESAGAIVWSLAVDGPASKESVTAFVQKERLSLPVLLPDAEVVGIYSVLNRHLFDYTEELSIPTTLLLDARGGIAKVYRGAVSVAQIATDVKQIEAPPEALLARAVPFAGTFQSPIKKRSDFQIGMDLSGRGFDDAALLAFERAVESTPDAITHYNLGTLYLKRGQRLRAELGFERALALQADYAEALNSLGVMLADRGDVKGAIGRFEAALKSRTSFADAMNNLGYAYLQLDRVDDALRLFQQALEAQPDFPEVHNNLGIYYGQEGDLERAATYFKRAVELRPGYSEAVNNLAMVHAATGRRDEAVGLLEGCLAADPAFEMTYVTLSRILFESGRRSEAFAVLEKLLQRNPKHPLALEMLSQIRGGREPRP